MRITIACQQAFMELQVIFFDVDNTLIDYDTSEKLAISKLCNYFQIVSGPGEDFVKLWKDVSKQYYEQYLSGKMTFQEQRLMRIKTFFKNIRASISEQNGLQNITGMTTKELESIFSNYLQYFEESWTIYGDVISVLDVLKSYRLGIISNGETEQQIKKLACVGIQDYFEVIVTSNDVGVSKPDSKIFVEAANKAEMPISGCFYIGDDLKKDAIAANEAGMTTFWLNRNKNIATCPEAIMVIESLSDLAACLKLV